jgi:ketosteroid isomerase-like protein
MSGKQPEEVENDFFESLINGDVGKLRQVIADDIVLIDVMTGSEVSGLELTEILRSGQLRFSSIDRIEFKVRNYQGVAIITGRTVMTGAYQGQQFRINSRYTHVFVKEDRSWRMVSAQGTPITLSGREADAPK